MAERKDRGKTTYLSKWEENYPWVQPHKINRYVALCKVCRTEFSIASMGQQALKSHSEGKKHRELVGSAGNNLTVRSFFAVKHQAPSSSVGLVASQLQSTSSVSCLVPEPVTSSVAAPIREPCATTSTSTTSTIQNKGGQISSFLTKDAVTRAEALWCLETVMTHNSLRNAASCCTLFKTMFPDSDIAPGMKLQKSKIAYEITYGLAPYFANELLSVVRECRHFVISFDESLNKIAQRQQMDLIIRFWDLVENSVQTRYLTSVFLSRATASDLLKGLTSSLAGLELKKILQISMDGPNVNFKLLKLLKSELRPGLDDPKFLDIGSCGIHTLHCAFKAGIKGTGWSLIEFLRALFNLWKNVPARRGMYTEITGSTLFPHKFCTIRWLENAPVANRAASILPHVKKYVEKVTESKKQPNCSSFKIVANAVRDELLPAKLAFFEALALDVEPFMREFQSDSPLAPFLYTALSTLVRHTMTRVLKEEVLGDEAGIHDVDIKNKENLRTAKQIELGYSTTRALSKCRVSEKNVLIFRQECRTCLQLFVQKILDRSPLKYPLTRALLCLNPAVIASASGGKTHLKCALEIMVDANLIEGSKADRVDREYSALCNVELVKDKMRQYSRKEQRLDNFWMELLEGRSDCDNLRDFVQTLLIISHGNAAVERGFSVNKEVIVTNQKEGSLIAQRQIFDAVTVKGGISNVDVTKSMIHYYRNAHSKYNEAIQEQKRLSETEQREQETKRKNEQLVKELEKKKLKLDEERAQIEAEIEVKKKELKKK